MSRTTRSASRHLILACLASCAGSSENTGANGPEAPTASPAGSGSPELHRGKLAPTPKSLTLGQFWPTKICTRGPGVIVVENNCACDSRMTCSASRRGGSLDLHVGQTQELCKDCGTFIATCAVPPGPRAKTYRITIDGKPALDALELPRSDTPSTQQCYE